MVIGQRLAVKIASQTIDELLILLEGRRKQLLGQKGSWVMRAKGIDDSIEALKLARKQINEEGKRDTKRTAETVEGSENRG